MSGSALLKLARLSRLLCSKKIRQHFLCSINNFFRQVRRYSKIFTFQFSRVAHDPFAIRIAKKTCDDLSRFGRLLIKTAHSVDSLKLYIAGRPQCQAPIVRNLSALVPCSLLPQDLLQYHKNEDLSSLVNSHVKNLLPKSGAVFL